MKRPWYPHPPDPTQYIYREVVQSIGHKMFTQCHPWVSPLEGMAKVLPTHGHAPMGGNMTCDVTQLPVVNKAIRQTKEFDRMANISSNTGKNMQTAVCISGQGKGLLIFHKIFEGFG